MTKTELTVRRVMSRIGSEAEWLTHVRNDAEAPQADLHFRRPVRVSEGTGTVWLPLTLRHSEILFDRLIRICMQEYRAVPGQRLAKQRIAKSAILEDPIVKRAKQTRLKKIADNLPRALGPLLETKKIATILYQRFRSESIHGATTILDSQRFFTWRQKFIASLCTRNTTARSS
jgi:hypothetical protein